MEGLISRVLDERQPATLKWLAYNLKVPSNKAKAMLEVFVSKYEDDTSVKLDVTYLIAGKADSKSSHHVQLVSGENLEKIEREMQMITSKHVYAVSVSGSAKSNTPLDLWNSDFQNARKLAHDDGAWGESFLKNAFGLVSYPRVKIKAASKRISVASSKPNQAKVKGGINSVYDQAAKNTKIKCAVSAKSFFGSSAGKSKSKKENKGKNDSRITKKSETNKDVMIGDTKNKTVNLVENTEQPKPKLDVPEQGKQQSETAESHARKRRIIDSDDEDDEFEFGESKNRASKKSKKKKVELSAEELEKMEKESNELKKQKREEIKDQRRLERERIKKAETEEAKARFAESLGVPAQSGSDKVKMVKRTKRVLKTKTYEDENGYLVTKDVWEEVEVEEVEKPVHVKPKVKPAEAKAKGTVINPTKMKVKQRNMLSFFTKKKKK